MVFIEWNLDLFSDLSTNFDYVGNIKPMGSLDGVKDWANQ